VTPDSQQGEKRFHTAWALSGHASTSAFTPLSGPLQTLNAPDQARRLYEYAALRPRRSLCAGQPEAGPKYGTGGTELQSDVSPDQGADAVATGRVAASAIAAASHLATQA